jgi:hypothetical protein
MPVVDEQLTSQNLPNQLGMSGNESQNGVYVMPSMLATPVETTSTQQHHGLQPIATSSPENDSSSSSGRQLDIEIIENSIDDVPPGIFILLIYSVGN